MINKIELNAHKIRNKLHTLLLFLIMAFILIYLGWIIAGSEGIIWAVSLSFFLLLISPKVPPEVVMKWYRARPLTVTQAWDLHQIVAELARRAHLDTFPKIYYIPSTSMNAFSVGNKNNPAIALTDGLIRALSLRELVAVMAHEIGHIYNNDMVVMGFADIINRVVSFFALFGIVVLVVSIPFYLLGLVSISWTIILILILSPTFVSLLQLTLSRTREFNADMEAARLTGDPEGLAMALKRLESKNDSLFKQIFFPGKSRSEPSMLRTHPDVDDRVERLMSIRANYDPHIDYSFYNQFQSPKDYQILLKKPRWHIGGLWY